MKKPIVNFGQSIRTRLLVISRRENVQHEYVLLRYAFDRFQDLDCLLRQVYMMGTADDRGGVGPFEQFVYKWQRGEVAKEDFAACRVQLSVFGCWLLIVSIPENRFAVLPIDTESEIVHNNSYLELPHFFLGAFQAHSLADLGTNVHTKMKLFFISIP